MLSATYMRNWWSEIFRIKDRVNQSEYIAFFDMLAAINTEYWLTLDEVSPTQQESPTYTVGKRSREDVLGYAA